MNIKTCNCCQKELPATEEFFRFKFSSKRAKKKTPYYICRNCEKKKQYEYNHRGKVKAQRRLWKKQKWESLSEEQKEKVRKLKRDKYVFDLEYRARVKKQKKKYSNNPKTKEVRKLYREKNKNQIQKYEKEYRSRPEVIERIQKQSQQRSQQPQYKYNTYVNGAKSRNLEWNISFEDFICFWQKPCVYCGTEIKTIGIDRIHSEKGYCLENVTSCCKVCNRMKSNMSYKDWVCHIKRLSTNQGGVSTGG